MEFEQGLGALVSHSSEDIEGRKVMQFKQRLEQRFDVFLSHSSEDKPWVRTLGRDLERYGVSVWVDEEQIRPGTPIVDALEQGIEDCRAMALVVSPESMASGWVKTEYNRALALAVRKHADTALQLIPVLLRTAELPGFLANQYWVDFRDPSGYAHNVWRLVWGITGAKPSQVIDLQTAAAPAPARPVAPAPEWAAHAPSREAALTSLLAEAFDGSAAELQRWLRLSLGADVHNSLRLDAPLAQLAFDTVLAVQQRGLTGALLESLRALRPHLGSRIRDVARLYGITLAP
jgi:hypothetical protein